MSLRNIQYQMDYRSGYESIVHDFFRPSLREAAKYWRAVGYFSSSALESFGYPLGEFINNGGKIKLITSVELSAADLEAITTGTPKEDICGQRLEQIIEDDFAEGMGDGTVRLARLLEMGRMEIRIAVPRVGTGIYHEKIGIFLDDSDYVAFSGSSNESRNAFENNRECIDVFLSWDSDCRAERKRKHFEALWEGEDKGVDVYSFPEATTKKLLRVCGEWEAKHRRKQKRSSKWKHQDEAVEVFLTSERGVLDMATGTGKTRTAMKIMEALFDSRNIDTVVVCTDGNDLLDQWYGELISVRENIGRDIRVYRHYSKWKQVDEFALGPMRAFILLSRQNADRVLNQLDKAQGYRTLLIHDEVHGLGSPGNKRRLRGLSNHVRYRLGLSATPERYYDEDGGNQFIEEHIGPVLMTFGLKEAIERGILAPFNYYPLPYQPTDEDRSRIAAVHKMKHARDATGDPMDEKQLWMAIARVYKTSEAKIPIFSDFIDGKQNLLQRSIVFTETMGYGRSVLEIIHKYRSDFHTYFTREEKRILTRFARRELECLMTCHRLSEGIDIQSLNTVILFSSEKGRLETIQRIGRCLRSNPNDPGKIANVVDFIRETDNSSEPNADEERRDWLLKLSRAREKIELGK